MDVGEMRREYVAYWSCYARAGERTDEDGASLFVTGLPAPGLNAVLAVDADADDEAARAFGARCRRRRMPYSWNVWPDEPTRDVDGMAPWTSLALMWRPPRRPVDPGPPLRFKALKPERLDAWCALLVDAFGLPASARRTAYAVHGRGLGAATLRYRVGLIDDEPVAVGILHTGAGNAGVYAVAVAPGQRRRGYGQAMTRHLLSLAPDRRAVLQATPAATAMYSRLGFRTLGALSQYWWRPGRA